VSKKSAKKLAKRAKKQQSQPPSAEQNKLAEAAAEMVAATAEARSKALVIARNWGAVVFGLALSHEAVRSALLGGWQLPDWLQVCLWRGSGAG
jgi:hypothetical protein